MNTSPQKTATITFTTDEARVLLQLIDVAVKSLGLNAAEAAAVLAKKINGAFLESPVGASNNQGYVGPTGNIGACAAPGVPSNVV